MRGRKWPTEAERREAIRKSCRESQRRLRKENPEEWRRRHEAYKARFAERNGVTIEQVAAAHYRAHREEISARHHAYYLAHKAEVAARTKRALNDPVKGPEVRRKRAERIRAKRAGTWKPAYTTVRRYAVSAPGHYAVISSVHPAMARSEAAKSWGVHFRDTKAKRL